MFKQNMGSSKYETQHFYLNNIIFSFIRLLNENKLLRVPIQYKIQFQI